MYMCTVRIRKNGRIRDACSHRTTRKGNGFEAENLVEKNQHTPDLILRSRRREMLQLAVVPLDRGGESGAGKCLW